MNWVFPTLSALGTPTATKHARRAVRTMLAVCGFCVCVTGVSFAQTTQPGQDEPKQEQPPPEDSPEPLGNARRPYRGLFGGANTGSRRETIVNFNGSVSGVYDQDELADDEESQLGGFYTNFTGGSRLRAIRFAHRGFGDTAERTSGTTPSSRSSWLPTITLARA